MATSPAGSSRRDGPVEIDPDLLGRLKSPFVYLNAETPLTASLQELRAEIDGRASETRLGVTSRLIDIHTEAKVRGTSSDNASLDRFYWSIQYNEGADFKARTLVVPKAGSVPTWRQFPDDERLRSLEALWGENALPHRYPLLEVLRYVPLRRFTFRSVFDGQDIIGKIKRPSRFREAWQLIDEVHKISARSNARFLCSRPLHLDEQHCLYLQTTLPGHTIETLMEGQSALGLAGRIGELCADLNAMHGEASLPSVSNLEWATKALEHLKELRLLMPDASEEVARLEEVVQTSARPGDAHQFCHGDFVISQLLMAGDQWAVTDFDLAHWGDPYRDVAVFVASLPYELPAASGEHCMSIGQQFIEQYFKRRCEVPDRRRLNWHALLAEIHYLALSVRKSRYLEARFANGLDRARLHSQRLRDQRVGPI